MGTKKLYPSWKQEVLIGMGKKSYFSHVEKDQYGKVIWTKLLREHLYEVGNTAKHYIIRLPIDHREELAEAVQLAGFCHDFGKYTTYFQDYLLEDSTQGNRHHHGFISAIFAAWCMERRLNSFSMPFKKYLPLLIYIAVLHHHGPLEDVSKTLIPTRKLRSKNFSQVSSGLRNRLLVVQDQIADLLQNIAEIEMEYHPLLSIELRLRDFADGWRNVLSDLLFLYYDYLEEDYSTCLELSYYCYLIYSALIDADKNDAAEVEELERLLIPADLVDRYSASRFPFPRNEMDKMRKEIYQKVTNKIMEVPLERRLYTLTAPTGTGKTLTSFSAALKLRRRIEEHNGYSPRIIYALPFTSVIDQNHKEIEKVLQCLPDYGEQQNRYLLKHHHLADLRYLYNGQEEKSTRGLLRIESWDAEVIVTTFIQLFYSVIGYQNSFLKKFHNLSGSIILLDEVQNIDVEYWPLIRQALLLLAEVMGCYIILLTATKPLIFEEGETTELLEDHDQYFKKLNRVTVYPNLTPMTVEDFCTYFIENIHETSKSYLIVMNTIKSSIMVYKRLKDYFHGDCVVYLSTNIVPRERTYRIKLIRRYLRKKRKVIVVSTQVVEAGVDIDLHTVIRDIGPIDSIVQVAGRCNRHMIKGKGEVHIFRIVDKSRECAGMVYGKVHSQYARELLEDKKIIEEKDFYDMIHTFFRNVRGAKNVDKSNKLLNALANLEFSSLEDFQLIEDNPCYIDVFVEINEKAKRIFQEYVSRVIMEKDPKVRRYNQLLYKRQFNKYIISVPLQLATGLNREYIEWGFLHLPLEGLYLYYNRETGFVRLDPGTITF